MVEAIDEIEKEYVETGKIMDVFYEMGQLLHRVVYMSAFGLKDLHKVRLSWLFRGKVEQIPIAEVLRRTASFMVSRTVRKEIAWVPYLIFFNYSKEDMEQQ